MYLIITCRPDISFLLIQLNQYCKEQALIHLEALLNLYRYVHVTKNDGIYYWRKKSITGLPQGQIPTCIYPNKFIPKDREQHDHVKVKTTVDSDYASDYIHRKSVSGINMKMADWIVHSKTKFQPMVSISTTEVEFAVACEAAKNNIVC